LLYWSERATRKDGSVYKTSADWEEELSVSGYAVRQFKKLPFIETTVQRANAYPTTHYRIRGGMLLKMVRQYLALQLKSAHGDDAQFDSTDRTVRQQAPVLSTITSVETDKSLTDITSDITPVNTTTRGPTQKNAPPGHSGTEIEREEVIKIDPKAPPGVFEMIQVALAEVTSCDPHLCSHAARLGRVARELMQAGYTPDNVRGFAGYWRANDFRYKKDKQLPTPEDVLAQIPRSKRTPRDALRESWSEALRSQYRSTGEE
jgi:AhpD family alkylhydroperoxidase